MMLGCLGVLLGIIIALWIWLGPLLKTAQKIGAFDPQVTRKYQGSSVDNLKAVHTALMLYQESEGQLPNADSWMDAAWPRLKTADLSEDEAKKKLKSPSLWETNPVAFGYAFNDVCSAKHSEDIADPKTTPLVFDSSDLTWNAHGSPAQLSPEPARPEGNYTVTVEGNVVKLADILRK